MRPRSLLAIWALLVALLVPLAGANGTALAMRRSSNGTSQIQLSTTLVPASGGTTVTVSGTGFAPERTITISIHGTALGSTTLGTTTTDGAGNFTATNVKIPAASPGTYVLAASDGIATQTATATLYLDAMTLSAASGSIGSQVQVSGQGLPANAQTAIVLGGRTVATTTTNGTGALPATSFTVPALSPGSQTLNVLVTVNGTAITAYTTPFTVQAAAPATLSLTPSNGPVGTRVTATGQGFAVNEQVVLTINGSTVATAATAGQGQFSVQFTLPANLAAGAVSVVATGASSHRAASATFTVTASTAIVLSATSAAQGGHVIISGRGFAPGEPVTLTLAGHVLATVGASAQGTFQTQVTLPAGLGAGSYTLTAEGQSSHRIASVSFAVTVARIAHVTLSTSTAAAGAALRISGIGFRPGETVQIAINGQPPFAKSVTGGNGSFAVTVTIPSGLVAGTYQVTVTGTISRATARTTLRIIAPVPPVTTVVGSRTWYFASGRVGHGYSEHLALLNPTEQAVHGTITLYYAGYQTRSVPFSLRPHARSTFYVGRILGVPGYVAAFVQASAPIAANTSVQRGIYDRMSTVGVPHPARTWYMAEGYTGVTFREYLDLLNPGTTPAQVRITWPLFNGRPAVVRVMTVAPRARLTVPVNVYVHKASHATIISSSQPIVAARTLYFGTQHLGADSCEAVTTPHRTLYFAEGSTANGFQEWLTILNPSASVTAQVTAHFYSRTGQLLGTRTIVVGPLHRGNIKVNNVVRYDAIATVLQSTQPIVAEREMYTASPNSAFAGGTDVFGHQVPAMGWAFANGNTLPGRSEFELLFNPNSTPSVVRATYYAANGQTVQRTFTVGPHTRMNIPVDRLIPGLPHGYHGVILQSVNKVPFFAEQAIYTDNVRFGAATTGTPIQ